MGTPTTFIKLDRNILSWGWFSTPATLSVWIFILIKANISDRKFQGIPVKRGELVTSYNSIAEACGISYSQARTAVEHLISTDEIRVRNQKKYLIITALNYDKYQSNAASSQDDNRPKTAEYSHFSGAQGSYIAASSQDNRNMVAASSQDNRNTIRNKEVKNERSVCEKHAHGIFNNIYLTDDEYKDYRLRVREIDAVIDELSESVAANPSKYRQGEITAWLNKFIRQKYGRLPERRRLLNDIH